MIHRIKYILLFIALPLVSYPQVIQKISIEGNKNFSNGDIKSWIQTAEGSKVYKGLLDTLKSRTAFNFTFYGYFNPDFTGSRLEYSADSQKVFITLNINEGEPTYIKNIFFSCNDSLQTKKYKPAFKQLEDQIFVKAQLENLINDALNKLENNGFPFAAFTISSIHFYKDSIKEKNYADIYLKLNTGRLSRINRVEVVGNASTKDYVVIRELRIDPGEYYSQKEIEQIPKRLNRLRFFNPVALPQFYINSKDEGVLLIKIKERQTNNFDGIIGYIPPANNSKSGYVTGLVNVSLRNLFGTGRAVAFRWRKLDRNSQELELKYLEPWLIGFPLNLNLRFYQRQQDTIYVQRNFNAGLEYLATESVSAAVSVTT